LPLRPGRDVLLEPMRLPSCINIMKGIHDDFRTDCLPLDEYRASQ
jgi:hypothetical protein